MFTPVDADARCLKCKLPHADSLPGETTSCSDRARWSRPITLGIYAVLLVVGGMIGYMKAGSRAFPDCRLDQLDRRRGGARRSRSPYKNYGIALGLVLSISLFILFGYRYAVKTRKFMPSGLLAVVSLVVSGRDVSDHGLDAELNR